MVHPCQQHSLQSFELLSCLESAPCQRTLLVRSLGLNAFELKNKIASEFQDAGVFVGGFTMVEVLQKTAA